MIRLRFATALAVVVFLASASLASASSGRKPTGGATTVALSRSFTSTMRSAGVTVSPTSGATGSAAHSSLRFPIEAGRLTSNPFVGSARSVGGLSFHQGERSTSVNGLVALLDRDGSLSLSAEVHVGRHRVCDPTYDRHRDLCLEEGIIKVLPIAAASISTSSGSTVRATVDVTAYTAQVIDKLTGRQTVRVGEPMGTITVAPTLR